MIKRIFDLAASAALILLAAPILLAVAVAVRVKLGAPVFYRHQRPGLGGKPFMLIKFRSMLPPGASTGDVIADEMRRLTPFGNWLRASSLDELPSLFNVIRGEMSLVGPRPLLMKYLPLYSADQMRRHDLRPGLTGWAQINGRSALSWDRKFALDIWYVDHRSFLLDMRILVMTAIKVLRREGVTPESSTLMPNFTGRGPYSVDRDGAGSLLPLPAQASDSRGPSMKITYIGHAGFIVDAGAISILIDPWFYAANLASIFPYPDNEFMVPTVLDRRFDYLYISHAHTDHFDRRLLERLDRDVTVICPSYRSRELEMLFKDMDFANLIKLGHLQQQALNDEVTVTMLLDSSAAEDSGLLIDHGGKRFLDLNDCQVNMGELPEADILACQFSGAIHYPQTYDMYTADEKDQKANQAVRTYVDLFERKVAAIKPKYFIPSAGPFCFLHPSLMRYNPRPADPTVFLDWERFAPQIPRVVSPDQVLRVFPGDEIETDAAGETKVHRHYDALNPHPNDTLEAYAKRRSAETAPFFARNAPEVATEDLRAHWEEIHRKNRRLLQFRDFAKSFVIQAYEQQDIVDAHQSNDRWLKRWYVSVSGAAVSVDDTPPPGFVSEYTFKLPMLMLRKVIDKKTNWDEMVASHHMLLSRDPDIFDPQFFALLRYHHVPSRSLLFAQIAIDSNELTAVPNSPGTLIQRYCPHAGEDLAGVGVVEGVIVCPRHRWQWDIETGRCLQGGNLPLRVVHEEIV